MWFGKLPEHWEAHKISELFEERREKVSDVDFAPLSVSKGGVVPQIATVAKSNAGDNRKLVRVGDFAINSRSDRRGSSGISVYDGSVSLINIVLTPRNETNGKYWHYLLKCHDFIEEFYRNGRGIVADLWTTRYDEMKMIWLPLPPREEQDQIVRYLDWKVSQINKLINAKRQQIELLKEKRSNLIDSVIGNSTGERHRFRNVFSLYKGLGITKADLKDEGVPCVNYGEIHSKYGFEVNPQLHALKNVDELYLEQSPKSLLRYGDFVFADTSEDLAGSGNFTYLNSDVPTFAGYHTIIARADLQLKHRYVAYYFDAYEFRTQIRQRVNGVKVYSITRSILNSTFVELPDEVEQDRIVATLDRACHAIDRSVELLNKELLLLAEYRTRLIADVVTGKKDVCGIAIP